MHISAFVLRISCHNSNTTTTACPSFKNSPVLVLFTPKHSDYPLPLFLPSYPARPSRAASSCLRSPQTSYTSTLNEQINEAQPGNKSSQSQSQTTRTHGALYSSSIRLVSKILSYILNSPALIHPLYHPLYTLSTMRPTCHFI
jgi:hypothetical protein